MKVAIFTSGSYLVVMMDILLSFASEFVIFLYYLLVFFLMGFVFDKLFSGVFVCEDNSPITCIFH